MQLLAKIDRVPPFLCVAIGTQVHGFSVAEIAKTAGVSLRTVTRLNDCTTWSGIRVSVADKVSNACQVDLLDPTLALDLLRESQGDTLFERLPPQQRSKVYAMFRRLKSERCTK